MKKINLFLAVLCVVALYSCKKDEPAGPVELNINATLEDGVSKWKSGESAYVYGKDNKAVKLSVKSSGGTAAVLSGIGTSSKSYNAFFPSSAAPTWNGSVYSVKIKSIQIAEPEKVQAGSNFLVGVGDSKNIGFKTIMGFAGVKVDFGKQKVKNFVVSASENLCGSAEITLENGLPNVSLVSGSKNLTISSAASEFANGSTYLIALMPGNYTNVKITVTSTSGEKKEVAVGNLAIKRNTVTKISDINLPDDVWDNEPEDTPGPYNYAAGKVTYSDGTPAVGIVVSDGFNCTKTDEDGKYRVYTCSDTWYIYISLPSDVRISTSDGCPKFFQRYDNMVKNYNFTLEKQAVETEFAIFAMADPQAHNAARSPQKKADTQRFLEEAVPALNTHITQQGIPCYGITLGDIVYSEGSRNSTGGMPTMRSHFSKVNMPVFQTMGNHDFTYLYSSKPLNTDATSSTLNLKVQRDFENCFGPINYSFNRGKTHFIMMKDVYFDSNTDASSYHCGFSDEQWEWFKQDMSYVPSDYQVVLNVHIPVAGCTGANNTHVMDVLNTIKTHPNSTVFSGHTHYYRGYPNVNSTGMFEHIHSAVCGQWWWSKIEGDGCPAGYHIYKFGTANIKDDYFVGFNEGMNMRDYQIRVYKGDLKTGGSYAYFQWPHTSSTLLINVFNGDSRWKVEVYEDGVLKGNASMMGNSKKTFSSVTKGETYDIPTGSNQDWWAIGLHIGYIGRGTTSTSYYTNMFHMWKYTLSNPSARIKVVATDPYGTKYECSDVITDGLSYPMMYRAW